ncbi:MAG: phosphoribosylglycinamide formyltransferase [Clostridia bacterium]|nr:phosphoribosylglycinamide formyltransferase [Clostridia bacterium]
MLKTKIAVLVSGGGTNLQALIDAQRIGKIKSGEIALVLSSNPTAFALSRAKNAGIPTVTVARKKCKDSAEFEEKIIKALDKYGAEIIVLAGFMSILSADFTKKYENRIINVHPSLIPAFCGKGFYGLAVHEAALSYGVKVTGATVHFVNEIPDGGKIISQKAIKVNKDDTPESLQKRVMRMCEWKILPEACEKVCADIAKSKPDEKQNTRKGK